MATYRDPFREVGAGFQRGTDALAEGLLRAREERIRQQDIQTQMGMRAEDIAREGQYRQDDLNRREGSTAIAQANAQLEAASTKLARLNALPLEQQEQYGATRADLERTIERLSQVVAGGEQFAAGMMRTLNQERTTAGMPAIPALIGQASGQASVGERRLSADETLRAANSQELRELQAQLNGLNPESITAASTLHTIVTRVRALQNAPLMPGDEEYAAAALASVEDALERIQSDPAFEQLWRNYLLRDAASTDRAQAEAVGADIENELRRLAVATGEQALERGEVDIARARLDIEQAQEVITGMRFDNYSQAFEAWSQFGAIHPDYRSELLAQFGGDEEAMEARSRSNFNRWQQAEEDRAGLLGIEVRRGEQLLDLGAYELESAEYARTRRTMDAVMASFDNWQERIASMVVNGDRSRLMHLETVLAGEGMLDPQLYASLVEAGITDEYLRSVIDEAGENAYFRDKSREVAVALANAEVRSALATGQQTSASARTIIAQSLTPDEIDGWFYSLTREEREALGGESVLAGMKRESRTAAFLSGEPQRQHAYQQASAIMATLPRNEAEAEEMAQAVYNVLIRAEGIGEEFAEAMFRGVQGLWDRDSAEWEMEIERHKMAMDLIRAQIAELNARAATAGQSAASLDPTMFNALRQGLAEERQSWQTQSDMLLTRMEQSECVVTEFGSSVEFGRRITSRGANAGSDECRMLTIQYEGAQNIVQQVGTDMAMLNFGMSGGAVGGARVPQFPQETPLPGDDEGQPARDWGDAGDGTDIPPPVPPPPGEGRTPDGDYTAATHVNPEADWRGASNAGLAPRHVMTQMANDIIEGFATWGQFDSWAEGMGYSDTQASMIRREIEAIIQVYGGMRD